MLTVSLVLFAAALALSTIAISIAAYHDIRDRDRRIRPQRTTTAASPHAARPTLRLWQPPTPSPPDDATAPTTKSTPSAGPDIVVGPRPLPSTAEEHDFPKAA